MTSPQTNPRRCYKSRGHPTFASSIPTSVHDVHQKYPAAEFYQPLRKSATFHSPKSPPSDDDPILDIPSLTRRSPTSPKDLENVVAAGESRIAQLIGSVDRSLSGLESFSSDSQETLRQEDLPVPRFILGGRIGEPDHMDVDQSSDRINIPKTQPRPSHNRHTSDSGLGSSVSSNEGSMLGEHAANKLQDYNNTSVSAIADVRTGINGYSSSNVDAHQGLQHALSVYACKQIQTHIISPILKEDTLKPFHPLIGSIPYRVKRKEITCLRDLEKVILWLAPVSGSYHVWERSLAHFWGSGVKRYSVSKSSFVKFCETSIQCLHTTVNYLQESDQRRPTDRPYTNGYFLDLTEQVRQYAAMITASRERIAAGKAREEGDYETDEKLCLHGGLGRTGRPAELVRVKDGQAISLRTGEAVQADAEMKGSASDEDLALSMARRKKSEQAAAKQAQRCSECDKEFKRPCDLTKHEKTHSRPWKCNEPSCKYSQYGWPTEKERDRHVNDKHAVTPSMYKCRYHPCPYESKRESNCKQHMEKAHGWAYVRSKNNGKGGKKAVSKLEKTPSTPQITSPGSYIFDASGSEFGRESTSPYMRNGYVPSSAGSSARASASPYIANGGRTLPSAGGAVGEVSTLGSPYLGNVNDPITPFEPSFSWGDSYSNRLTPQTSYTPSSHRLSMESLTNASTIPSSFEMENDPPLFGGSFDWSNMDYNAFNIQINTFTPMSSGQTRSLDTYSSRNPSISVEHASDPKNPNFSPGAQGNEMLYSPYSTNDVIDEGYDEFAASTGKPANDFALFDDSRPPSSLGTMNLFSDLPPFQPSTWSGMTEMQVDDE